MLRQVGIESSVNSHFADYYPHDLNPFSSSNSSSADSLYDPKKNPFESEYESPSKSSGKQKPIPAPRKSVHHLSGETKASQNAVVAQLKSSPSTEPSVKLVLSDLRDSATSIDDHYRPSRSVLKRFSTKRQAPPPPVEFAETKNSNGAIKNGSGVLPAEPEVAGFRKLFQESRSGVVPISNRLSVLKESRMSNSSERKSLVRAASFSFALEGGIRDFLVL